MSCKLFFSLVMFLEMCAPCLWIDALGRGYCTAVSGRLVSSDVGFKLHPRHMTCVTLPTIVMYWRTFPQTPAVVVPSYASSMYLVA